MTSDGVCARIERTCVLCETPERARCEALLRASKAKLACRDEHLGTCALGSMSLAAQATQGKAVLLVTHQLQYLTRPEARAANCQCFGVVQGRPLALELGVSTSGSGQDTLLYYVTVALFE